MRLARSVDEITGFEMLLIMGKTKKELEGELLENVGGHPDDDEDGEEGDEEDESDNEGSEDDLSDDEHLDSDEDYLDTFGTAGLGEEVFSDDGESDEKMFMNLRAIRLL